MVSYTAKDFSRKGNLSLSELMSNLMSLTLKKVQSPLSQGKWLKLWSTALISSSLNIQTLPKIPCLKYWPISSTHKETWTRVDLPRSTKNPRKSIQHINPASKPMDKEVNHSYNRKVKMRPVRHGNDQRVLMKSLLESQNVFRLKKKIWWEID